MRPWNGPPLLSTATAGNELVRKNVFGTLHRNGASATLTSVPHVRLPSSDVSNLMVLSFRS
jgi:hypothetical protein